MLACISVIFFPSSHFLQPKTALVPPVLVPTVGRVWEEETRFPASAKRAGKAPPADRVSTSAKLLMFSGNAPKFNSSTRAGGNYLQSRLEMHQLDVLQLKEIVEVHKMTRNKFFIVGDFKKKEIICNQSKLLCVAHFSNNAVQSSLHHENMKTSYSRQ